jgi:trehalose 6-phosphate phosphatase
LTLPDLLAPLAIDPGHNALFLDFDGTLSSIVDDPVAARPLPGVSGLLAALAGPFGLVAVISGRPTAFLSEVLEAPPGVRLVGLYGLELELGGAGAEPWSSVMADVVEEAVAEAPEGVYVEPKGLTVTLHWRHAPEARPWVTAFAGRQVDQRGLRVHPGRMELELRPPLEVDKGTVVRRLAGGLAPPLRAVAVFGDDMGDLPAFGAVGQVGASTVVRVAVVDDESPPQVAAAADLTVAGATGAVALLHELARAAGADQAGV